jgi:hypothetical protein
MNIKPLVMTGFFGVCLRGACDLTSRGCLAAGLKYQQVIKEIQTYRNDSTSLGFIGKRCCHRWEFEKPWEHMKIRKGSICREFTCFSELSDAKAYHIEAHHIDFLRDTYPKYGAKRVCPPCTARR